MMRDVGGWSQRSYREWLEQVDHRRHPAQPGRAPSTPTPAAATSRGVPVAITRPPASPPPGPRSTTQSAVAIGVEVVLDEDDGVARVDEAVQLAQQQGDVGGVQARRSARRGGRASGRGCSLQLGGELDPLGLAAAQLGRGLAEPQVAEPHLLQRVRPRAAAGTSARKAAASSTGIASTSATVRLAIGHLERLGVVARAVAGRARRVGAGQEDQLDRDEALPLAGLAAALGDVEREPPGAVPARAWPPASRRTAGGRRRTARCTSPGWSAGSGRSAAGRRRTSRSKDRAPDLADVDVDPTAGPSSSSGAGPRWRRTTSASTCVTRVDFPEPETPVTAVSAPSGRSSETSLRLCRETPPRCSQPCGGRGSRSSALGPAEQVRAGG